MCSRQWCSRGYFFFNDTATTEIYTLSLHDALPISTRSAPPSNRSTRVRAFRRGTPRRSLGPGVWDRFTSNRDRGALARQDRKSTRLNSSHQIISYAVFCLKKKNIHCRPQAATIEQC